ncbi:SGNH/GDSL hydrolase family protein [Williamsia sp.]|uniref:SGNH/GDSL hydrolase family protein n=1 Tax=Williamsia sp. TaxID=1872085 RepID=UPI0025D63EA1|nr:SGNH/GDSL hydrolase family protein [Williamsia sp.]
MMRRPFLAAVATTIVIVMSALVATLVPWSVLTGSTTEKTAVPGTPKDDRAPIERAPRYVALGSSYASGPDSSGVINTRCLRTGDDYPHQVAAALRLDLTDVSCSGSTIPDILHRAQPHRADAPQIDAVTADTDLVTVTTGGNDVGYIGRLTSISCTNQLTRATMRGVGVHCRDEPPRNPPTASDFARLEREMIAIVEAVRLRAPKAVVVIVNYPPVLDPRGTTCASVPLTPAEAATTVATFDGLRRATDAAARATASILVDAASPGADHTACSASPWVYGYRLPAPYHPNADGRRAMARLTTDAIAASGFSAPTTPR